LDSKDVPQKQAGLLLNQSLKVLRDILTKASLRNMHTSTFLTLSIMLAAMHNALATPIVTQGTSEGLAARDVATQLSTRDNNL